MINIEDVDNVVVLVDPIADAVGAAPRAMTASERPEQRLADSLRVDRKCGFAKFQHSSGNSFW